MRVCVCVDRKREESKREDGTGVCRDQCMVHTSTGLQARKGESEWWEREREREGGRVYDREETGVEWMRPGFCLGRKTCGEEE